MAQCFEAPARSAPEPRPSERRTIAMNFLRPITGCIGQPVAENPTQVMIEAAYRDLDLDWRYITLEVGSADLADAVRGMRALGFAGFNCTIPHKVDVIEHLDGLGESARLMHAVNCVVRDDDRLTGENTDGKGFVRALTAQRDPRGADVVQAMLERGFLVNNTSATTVRFLPPLVITGDELAKALAALRDVLSA